MTALNNERQSMLRRKREESSEKQVLEGVAGQEDHESPARKKVKTGMQGEEEAAGDDATAGSQATGSNTYNNDTPTFPHPANQSAIRAAVPTSLDDGGTAPDEAPHANVDGESRTDENAAEERKIRALGFLATLRSNLATQQHISELESRFKRMTGYANEALADQEAAERVMTNGRYSGAHCFEDLQQDRAYAINCRNDYIESRGALGLQLDILRSSQDAREARLYEFVGVTPDDSWLSADLPDAHAALATLPPWFWEAFRMVGVAFRQKCEAQSEIRELERQQAEYFKSVDKIAKIGHCDGDFRDEMCALSEQSKGLYALFRPKWEIYNKLCESSDMLEKYESRIMSKETSDILEEQGFELVLPDHTERLPFHTPPRLLVKQRQDRYEKAMQADGSVDYGSEEDYDCEDQVSVAESGYPESYYSSSSGNVSAGSDDYQGPQPEDNIFPNRQYIPEDESQERGNQYDHDNNHVPRHGHPYGRPAPAVQANVNGRQLNTAPVLNIGGSHASHCIHSAHTVNLSGVGAKPCIHFAHIVNIGTQHNYGCMHNWANSGTVTVNDKIIDHRPDHGQHEQDD